MRDIKVIYCYFTYDQDWYACKQSIKSLRNLAYHKDNRNDYAVIVLNDSNHPIEEHRLAELDADEVINTQFDRGGNLIGLPALTGVLNVFVELLKKYKAEYICKIDSDVLLCNDFYTSKEGYKLTGWSWGGYEPAHPDEGEELILHGAFYKMANDLPQACLDFIEGKSEEEIIKITKCRWKIQEDYQIGELAKLIYNPDEINIEHCRFGNPNCVLTYSMSNINKAQGNVFDKNCALVTFDFKNAMEIDKLERLQSKRTTYFRMKELVDYKIKEKYEPDSKKLDLLFVVPTFKYDSHSVVECLRSIITNFQYYRYEIIVLDDNSNPLPYSTVEHIKKVAKYRMPEFPRGGNLNGKVYCENTLQLYKDLFETYKPEILIKTDSDCIVRDSLCLELMDDPDTVLGGFRRREDLEEHEVAVFGAWMMFRERAISPAIENLKNIDNIPTAPARVRKSFGEDFTISWAIYHSYPDNVVYYECNYDHENENKFSCYNGKMGMLAFSWKSTWKESHQSPETFNRWEVIHYGNPIKFKDINTGEPVNISYRQKRVLIAYKMREYNDHFKYLTF